MKNDTVIKVENLSKKFCTSIKRSMFYGTIDVARDMLGINYDTSKLRKREFWALKDVNFELSKGETLGIIGSNGSGKSTLLRLLNGIFPPDVGKIEAKGNIGALISVGAGFHPHMTGKENIYLNGTILGMSNDEIKENFQSIIDFAEIGDFIDSPVATYSSGMRVRLGFAIAIHSTPDILLIDEILSVGDLSFRNKSLRKMNEFREQANAIIFVSHNLEQVRNLCDRTMVLNKGKVEYLGDTHTALIKYEEITRENEVRKDHIKRTRKFTTRISSNGEIEFQDIYISNEKGDKLESIGMDDPLYFYARFKLNEKMPDLYFSAAILNEDGKPCIWVMSNDDKKINFEDLKAGTYELIIKIKEHHLMPNVYKPNLAIRNDVSGETYERILPTYSFRVKAEAEGKNRKLSRGLINVDEEWKLKHINC